MQQNKTQKKATKQAEEDSGRPRRGCSDCWWDPSLAVATGCPGLRGRSRGCQVLLEGGTNAIARRGAAEQIGSLYRAHLASDSVSATRVCETEPVRAAAAPRESRQSDATLGGEAAYAPTHTTVPRRLCPCTRQYHAAYAPTHTTVPRLCYVKCQRARYAMPVGLVRSAICLRARDAVSGTYTAYGDHQAVAEMARCEREEGGWGLGEEEGKRVELSEAELAEVQGVRVQAEVTWPAIALRVHYAVSGPTAYARYELPAVLIERVLWVWACVYAHRLVYALAVQRPGLIQRVAESHREGGGKTREARRRELGGGGGAEARRRRRRGREGGKRTREAGSVVHRRGREGAGARRGGGRGGFRVPGSGFRVPGSGFRVQDSGFRVQDSGFR
eukprot:2342918-Rhodomonas_salina.1